MKLVVSLVLGLGVIPLAGSAVSAAPVVKEPVCHGSDGGWKLLELPMKAADNRITRHGDGYPEGPVPGSDGEFFDQNCVPFTPPPDVPEPPTSETLASVCGELGGDWSPGTHAMGPYVSCVVGGPDEHAGLIARWDPLCNSLYGPGSAMFVYPENRSVCFT